MKKKIKSVKKEKSIKVCPRCNSSNISIDPTNPLFASEGLPPTYVCNNCNYSGKIFPEINSSDYKKFKKVKFKLNKKKLKSDKVDKSYGRFIVRGVWKITGPILLIFAIFFIYISFNPIKCFDKNSEDFMNSPYDFNNNNKVCEKDLSRIVDPEPLLFGISLFLGGLISIYFAYKKYKD